MRSRDGKVITHEVDSRCSDAMKDSYMWCDCDMLDYGSMITWDLDLGLRIDMSVRWVWLVVVR